MGGNCSETVHMYRKTQKITKKTYGELREYVEGIRDRFEVKEVYLFGSQAKGNSHKYSDYDLAIVTEKADKNRHELLVDLLGTIRNVNLLIEPHPMTKEDLKDPDFLLGKEVKKCGIRIL